jgi:hypothetical protein
VWASVFFHIHFIPVIPSLASQERRIDNLASIHVGESARSFQSQNTEAISAFVVILNQPLRWFSRAIVYQTPPQRS